jgi:DNA-binding NarL/FixJ family response regulator
MLDPVEGRRNGQLRALVVDDFQPFRKLVCSILTEQIGAQVVGEAADGLDAFYKFRKLKPNLVVLDLDLPTLNGLEITRILRITLSDCRILLCTVEMDPGVVLEAFRCSVDAYLIKADLATELRPALEAVLQGKRYISETILRRVNE